MKKKRVKKGEFYFFVDIFNTIHKIKEQRSAEDKYNFFINNYFRTKKQALKEIERRSW